MPSAQLANRRLIVAGLVVLALLALGEAAPIAFPVHVSIEGHAAALQVSVDGQTHSLSSALGGGWSGVALEQPGPLQREYQIDGSDTTATNDRDPAFINALLGTPLYAFDAWLRDESGYSRWVSLQVTDLASGQAVSPDAQLPNDFRLDVDLQRPEAPARVWLLGPTPDRREGLELDRDRRNARWLIQRGGGTDALPRWFFPEQPAPFAAELLKLTGRSAAAGYALLLVTLGLARLMALLANTRRGNTQPTRGLADARGRNTHPTGLPPNTVTRTSQLTLRWPSGVDISARSVLADVVLGVWLIAAALVTTRAYHQLPHILDAISYTFQAGLFATGQLSQASPPLTDAFKGPFEVVWQGRIFSQYPPGAPALYALGDALRVEWLVGPLACLALLACTAYVGRRLFGPTCAVAVLVLGVLSPFVLFQAGSFLSHPIAGGLVAGALAAFVAAECGGSVRWYAVTGALLGAGFLAREIASVLFAVPLGVRLLATRRWTGLTWVVAYGMPFVLAYLFYNLRQTGSPLLLPRMLFDPSDHFGFGDGIGFHTRHTLAAGLANTDELLTLLQFDLFGWPPLFAFGLLGLPFLLGRANAWDWMAAGGFLAFVVAYVGYFYHGIALGPRYYFEAMPWLLLLGGRGVQTLTQVVRSRAAPALLVAALSLNTVLFYVPAELGRRVDMSGFPNGLVKLNLDFVQASVLGPQLSGIQAPALVLTDDWWLYHASLAALNCPRLPQCDVLFALATSPEDVARLRAQFPDRMVLRAVENSGHVDLVPFG